MKTHQGRFSKGREKVINDFESKIISAGKRTQRKELKILIPKQRLEIFPFAFAQIKTGNSSENALNEIRQIILCIEQNKLPRK